MRKVTVHRTESDDSGTFGKWSSDSGFECYTGELPDRDNAPGKSCIPAGVYQCEKRNSPKHGPCYYILNVPKRTDIEIHKGNFCGDVDKGLKSDVLGCMLLGNAIGELAGQKCVIGSGDALSRAMADLDGVAFQLTIGYQ